MKKFNLMLFTFLFCLMARAEQPTINQLAQINIDYGALDISIGGGSLAIAVDENNKIVGVGFNVLAGFMGIEDHRKGALTLSQLMDGESLNYSMPDAKEPLIKTTALSGFGPDGGDLKVSIRRSDRFVSKVVKLARDSATGKFSLWAGDHKVSEIKVNIGGYGFSDFYVDWYKLIVN